MSLGIDLDRALLPAFGSTASDVAVSKGRFAGSASGLGLLSHALEHLGSEVAGVELRDRRHDAVQQHPGGGLVDVLSCRDESRAGLPDGHSDLDVVHSVAGQAVDLMDENEIDAVAEQIGEHSLEVGTVG
nr:hypothetical protein [Streptomyces sp. 846.5]